MLMISAEKSKIMAKSDNNLERSRLKDGMRETSFKDPEQLSKMMAQIKRFSRELHKPLQLPQRCGQYGMETFCWLVVLGLTSFL